jgi:hypothetical protein
MNILTENLQNKLDRLLQAAPELVPGADHKLVIFSDLHLGDGDYYRVVLKEEDLDYIFTKIDLLG